MWVVLRVALPPQKFAIKMNLQETNGQDAPKTDLMCMPPVAEGQTDWLYFASIKVRDTQKKKNSEGYQQHLDHH